LYYDPLAAKIAAERERFDMVFPSLVLRLGYSTG
jgi:hypothetical protein